MRAVEKLLATKRLLTNLSRDFSPVAMFQSFSVEDMVLTDLIYADLVHQEYSNIKMFTIDTGRLPDELHLLIEQVRNRYGDVLKVYYPDSAELEQFDAMHSFRRDYRARSNEVRLHQPLLRALQGYNAWISGSDPLNTAMNSHSLITWDETHKIPRFNPLSRWSREEIWSYSQHHNLPLPDFYRDMDTGQSRPGESGWWWQTQPESQELRLTRNIA